MSLSSLLSCLGVEGFRMSKFCKVVFSSSKGRKEPKARSVRRFSHVFLKLGSAPGQCRTGKRFKVFRTRFSDERRHSLKVQSTKPFSFKRLLATQAQAIHASAVHASLIYQNIFPLFPYFTSQETTLHRPSIHQASSPGPRISSSDSGSAPVITLERRLRPY